jgi:hypothetical protein
MSSPIFLQLLKILSIYYSSERNKSYRGWQYPAQAREVQHTHAEVVASLATKKREIALAR